MYQIILTDIKFHNSLFQYDQQIALKVRKQGCPCGGKLHTANYLRKPRGIPQGVDENFCIRFSFCCNVEGCRKRTTPPSLRFLGRKVYTAITIIIVFTLGLTISEQIDKYFSCKEHILSNGTIVRWRQWWKQLPSSTIWRRQGLGSTINQERLPNSLLESFNGNTEEKIRHMLLFLSPLSI
jgi:hypothetical protein